MNIFYRDKRPINAARAHCDQHCVKMILETAQLLSTAHRELDGDEYADARGLYKSTHKNHPSAIWVREGQENYRWAYLLLVELCLEYGHRYGKTHKTERMGLLDALRVVPANISADTPFTEPPQCFGEGNDHLKGDDTVEAYRRYYRSKATTMKKPPRWRHTEPPLWWNVSH
jgi:hypothetical protein